MKTDLFETFENEGKYGLNPSNNFSASKPLIPAIYDEIIILKEDDEPITLDKKIIGVKRGQNGVLYDVYTGWCAGGPPLDSKVFIGYDLIQKDLTEAPELAVDSNKK